MKRAKPADAQKVDLALSVLCALTPPGKTMSIKDIADVCEVNKKHIEHLLYSAKRKLQRKPILKQYHEELE